MTPKFEASDFSNLVLEVHTVGYPTQGESIVTMLKDGDRVLFTVVTDSFCTDSSDEVSAILHRNGDPHINIFVWTHPDEDHSVGIENLLTTFDSQHEAIVYIPANISRELMNNDSARTALDYLVANYNKMRRYNLSSIGSTQGIELPHQSFVVKSRRTGREIVGYFHFLLPDTSMSFRRAYHHVRNSGDMNDFSIVYVLSLNGLRYFYGADMTNSSMKFLRTDKSQYLDNIRFIKIPHHGSKDSAKAVGLLKPYEEKKAVATTTVYGATNPFSPSLDAYKSICAYVSSTDRGLEPFGCIQMDFKVNDTLMPTPICRGNAKQVR